MKKKARNEENHGATLRILENQVLTWDDAKPLRRGKIHDDALPLIYNMNLFRKLIAAARAYFLRG